MACGSGGFGKDHLRREQTPGRVRGLPGAPGEPWWFNQDGDISVTVDDLVQHTAGIRAVGTGPANSSVGPGGTVPGSGTGGTGQGSGPDGTGAVPGTGDSRRQDGREGGLLQLSYEEYFVEHDVATADARDAAKEIKLDDEWSVMRRAGCGSCSRRELEYCESRVLSDHCCCERRYLPEPFPWMPHTCYVGPRQCRPLAHDCALYTRLRDCCCIDKLAKRWKNILSSAPRTSPVSAGGVAMLAAVALLAAAPWLRG